MPTRTSSTGIGGERNANRIADAFGEQRTQTDGGLDRADRSACRLR